MNDLCERVTRARKWGHLICIWAIKCISFYRTKRKENTSERNSIGRRNKQIISFIHTFRLHALLLFSSNPKALVESLVSNYSFSRFIFISKKVPQRQPRHLPNVNHVRTNLQQPKSKHTNQLLRDRIYTIDVLLCALQTEKKSLNLCRRKDSNSHARNRIQF